MPEESFSFYGVETAARTKELGDIRENLGDYKMCADLKHHQCLNHFSNKTCFVCRFKFFIKDPKMIELYTSSGDTPREWNV